MEGSLGRGRLPTEAEWEYACRAGSMTRYSFGDKSDELGEYAWFRSNSGNRTHPVGQKKPNAWGLFELHGNVWEWCWDLYGAYDERFADDPQGEARHVASNRVFRGGSWLLDSGLARSARRSRNAPDRRRGDLGFRLARGRAGR
jgi:formylglycine-generating enzyme required for sulfatase activity